MVKSKAKKKIIINKKYLQQPGKSVSVIMYFFYGFLLCGSLHTQGYNGKYAHLIHKYDKKG